MLRIVPVFWLLTDCFMMVRMFASFKLFYNRFCTKVFSGIELLCNWLHYYVKNCDATIMKISLNCTLIMEVLRKKVGTLTNLFLVYIVAKLRWFQERK